MAYHRTAIPLPSIAGGERGRYTDSSPRERFTHSTAPTSYRSTIFPGPPPPKEIPHIHEEHLVELRHRLPDIPLVHLTPPLPLGGKHRPPGSVLGEKAADTGFFW